MNGANWHPAMTCPTAKLWSPRSSYAYEIYFSLYIYLLESNVINLHNISHR